MALWINQLLLLPVVLRNSCGAGIAADPNIPTCHVCIDLSKSLLSIVATAVTLEKIHGKIGKGERVVHNCTKDCIIYDPVNLQNQMFLYLVRIKVMKAACACFCKFACEWQVVVSGWFPVNLQGAFGNL